MSFQTAEFATRLPRRARRRDRLDHGPVAVHFDAPAACLHTARTEDSRVSDENARLFAQVIQEPREEVLRELGLVTVCRARGRVSTMPRQRIRRAWRRWTAIRRESRLRALAPTHRTRATGLKSCIGRRQSRVSRTLRRAGNLIALAVEIAPCLVAARLAVRPRKVDGRLAQRVRGEGEERHLRRARTGHTRPRSLRVSKPRALRAENDCAAVTGGRRLAGDDLRKDTVRERRRRQRKHFNNNTHGPNDARVSCVPASTAIQYGVALRPRSNTASRFDK